MTQNEKRAYLIRELLAERKAENDVTVPVDEVGQKRLLRSLFNVRMPKPVSDSFLQIQDEYLQTEIKKKGITDIDDLLPIFDGIYLWQGDITTLRCDAAVNAANSEMLGCFCPCHQCIDNAVHTFAGVELRKKCAEIMKAGGRRVSAGAAIITSAYNLPCKYVIHTVGPIVSSVPTKRDCELLEECYRNCLEIAEKNGVGSIAFCCISTGEYRFPHRQAAEIAVRTVMQYKKRSNSRMKVIFNVFKDTDAEIYREILGEYCGA